MQADPHSNNPEKDSARHGLRRRKNRTPQKTIVPTESEKEEQNTQQMRTFGAHYHWALPDAERRCWLNDGSSMLATLRVFCYGHFVQSKGHLWERTHLQEGILIYCTDGKGFYWQDGHEWEVHPGDLLYCPPSTHHRYWADENQPWTIHWMHLSGDALPEYESLLGLLERGPLRHIGIHDNIKADFTRITLEHSSASGELYWFSIQSIALAILGHIAELPHHIADIADIADSYGPVQKIITLMRNSLDQPYDARRFSRELGCSERHFARQFRSVTGMSPGDWFIQRKLERACALLSQPGIRIKDVATLLGYSDSFYFSRLFKRSIHSSPQTYRRKQLSHPTPQAPLKYK